MTEHIVIIGAGQAGAQAVATLRAEGFAGAAHAHWRRAIPPYQRPPLSKAYLAGTFERERLFLKPEAVLLRGAMRTDSGRCRNGDRSRSARTVALADGRAIAYDRLLLATGSRVRRISVAGADLSGIHLFARNSRCGSVARRVPETRAARRGRRRLYRARSGSGRGEARARSNGVRIARPRHGPGRIARMLSAFYENVHRAAGVRHRTERHG